MTTATNSQYRTHNDLDAKVRQKMEDLCNHSLADALDMQLQSKQAHWNVKGPNFIALHKLFDEIYESVTEYVDLLAERVVQLGGTARGTLGAVTKATRLPAYPENIADGKAHIDAMVAALSTFGKHIRSGIDTADQAGDKDTADIFTEISRGIDKWLWFVEAHHQASH